MSEDGMLFIIATRKTSACVCLHVYIGNGNFLCRVRQIIANRAGVQKIIDDRVLHFIIAQSVNKN